MHVITIHVTTLLIVIITTFVTAVGAEFQGDTTPDGGPSVYNIKIQRISSAVTI